MKAKNKPRVLFVEDDSIDQMAIKRMAESSGAIQDYTICDSLSAYSSKMASGKYDLVVTDYHLKDGMGIDVVKQAGNRPVIMVTGLGDETLAVKAMKAGASDYLVKDPYNNYIQILPIAIKKTYSDHLKSIAYIEAEERYHDLFENATDLIQSTDIKGNFVYVNPSWRSVLGYTKKDIAKLKQDDVIHPEFRRRWLEILENIKQGNTFRNQDLWLRSKKAEKVIVEGNFTCKFDQIGNPIAIRGILRDVTENRRAQEELRENEEKYRLLVESADDVIYYSDLYGNLQYVNKHGPTFTGYSSRELNGMHYTQLVDPNYLDEVVTFYEDQVSKKKASTYLEFPLAKKNGKKFWVGQRVRTLYDESSGTIVGYFGIVRDINEKKIIEEQLKMSNQALEKRVQWRTRELEKTNSKLRLEIDLRVRAEKALMESERDYRELFRTAHDALIIFDPTTKKILEVNQQACKIYQYKRTQLLGKKFSSLATDAKREYEELSHVSDDLDYHNYETTHRAKSGQEMILEANATIISYKGQPAVLSINKDITLKKEVEQKLKEERNRRMSALIDGQEMERKRLSRELHDGLGQLLTASLIYLKQLYKVVNNKKGEQLVDKTKEIIDDTVEEVRTISHNLMPAVLYDLGLKLALQNMVNSLNARFSGSLRFYQRGETRRIKSDVEIGLYRIAQEALNNALKYSKADKINISLLTNERVQKLTIKDNGIGFDPSANALESGNGLYNMQQRSKLIGCNFTLNSMPNRGTEINVTCDLSRYG